MIKNKLQRLIQKLYENKPIEYYRNCTIMNVQSELRRENIF